MLVQTNQFILDLIDMDNIPADIHFIEMGDYVFNNLAESLDSLGIDIHQYNYPQTICTDMFKVIKFVNKVEI